MTRRNALNAKNPTLQSLADVVQFIASTFNASDGQNLFQFQFNEEENDTEMVDQDANTCPGVIPVCQDVIMYWRRITRTV